MREKQKPYKILKNFGTTLPTTFQWHKLWDKVLEYDFHTAHVNWFLAAKLNITENCLDRHLATQAKQTAIIFEPNDPKEPAQHISYKELHSRVCQAANMLKANGAKKGDRICLYMPMVPELAIAVLACARIGAIHSVVFAGFSATALAARINDAECMMLITADGGYRGTKITPLKEIADQALKQCPSIKRNIVLRRTRQDISWNNIDRWWHDEFEKVNNYCPAEVMDSEDPLFILYLRIYRKAKRNGTFLWWLYGIYGLHLSKCVSVPKRPNLLVYCRYRLDHWTFIYSLWPLGRWCNNSYVCGSTIISVLIDSGRFVPSTKSISFTLLRPPFAP